MEGETRCRSPEVRVESGREMKPFAMTLALAALTGILAVEMWHLSDQRFWLFCALLLFVSESIFLGAKLLGDTHVTRALGWRFCGFSDWVSASISVAAIALGLVACSVLTYQVLFSAPVGACGEICRP